MLRGQNGRVPAHGKRLGRLQAAPDFGQARWRAKIARFTAYGRTVFLNRTQQLPFRTGQITARLRELRLSKRYVSICYFTNFKTIARRTQLFDEELQVLVAQRYNVRGFNNPHISRNSTQEHALLNVEQCLSRGQHGLLSSLDPVLTGSKVVNQQLCNQID